MKFMILCHTRSGSNLLVNLLSSHNQLKVYGEIFSLDRLALDQVGSIIDNPLEYLQKKLNSKSENIQAIGFKMLYDNFKLDYFEKEITLDTSNAVLKDRNYILVDFVFGKYSESQLEHQFDTLWDYYGEQKDLKIIHLKRRNLLKTFVSLKRAFITDEWIQIKNKKVGDITFRIEKEELENYFERTKGFENYYNDFFSDHQMLHVDYEDLVSDRNKVLSEVLHFLDMSPVELTSVLKKQNRASLRENVENYEQLKSHFSSTQWGHYFDE